LNFAQKSSLEGRIYNSVFDLWKERIEIEGVLPITSGTKEEIVADADAGLVSEQDRRRDRQLD
jgi:hypothetical protein